MGESRGAAVAKQRTRASQRARVCDGQVVVVFVRSFTMMSAHRFLPLEVILPFFFFFARQAARLMRD